MMWGKMIESFYHRLGFIPFKILVRKSYTTR